jgi:endonuclease G
VVLKNKVFEVNYSQKLKQPLTLEYKSTNRPTNVNRGSMDFYSEPNINTSGPEDYKKNEWDKGHMAPAADFNCTLDMLKKTFSYLNCALQQENLNRGAWRLLEARERKLAASANVTVIIDVIFTRESVVLPTGATIPTAFYKEIRYGGKKECYYFPNKKPATTDFTVFKCNCR